MKSATLLKVVSSVLRSFAFTAGLAVAAGCGGGSGGSGSPTPTPPTPAADFRIAATPTSLSFSNGGTQTCTVYIVGVNGLASAVTVSVSGLPLGVTASPATFSIMPGAVQQVAITVESSASTGSPAISFNGVSGSASHSAAVSLAITNFTIGTVTHAPVRNRYLRTDAIAAGSDVMNSPPHFTVYDAAHKQFFVSNPYLNEIDVFDGAHEIETAKISVPSPWGIDVSPYNGMLYAGTLLGDVYQIDTTKLSVVKRYPAASIGPKGFYAAEAYVLSDGRLALMGGFGGVLYGVDGFPSVVVWNPATNAMDSGTTPNGADPEVSSVCPFTNLGPMAVSGDRKRILATWVLSGGGGVPLCSYDPIAKHATLGNFASGAPVRSIVPTPDGTKFFVTGGIDGVPVFDAKTVQQLGLIPPDPTGNHELPETWRGVVSLDSKTLYLGDRNTSAVAAYDTTSLAQTGWVPGFSVVDDYQSTEVLSAIDETGLIAGPIGHGVAFTDGSQLKATMPTLMSVHAANPLSGPLAGGTAIGDFAEGIVGATAPKLESMFIGDVLAVQPSWYNVAYSSWSAKATTPSTNVNGAVDLAMTLDDGAVAVAPEAFTYGPLILDVIPNGATAEGGQTGAIVGYAIGTTLSDVQVTVGGKPAAVTAVFPYSGSGVYPVPAHGLQFTVPPGTAGTTVDVTVTTADGTTTAKSAFEYAPAVESYPLTASLQSGIYDARRDLYYFTDKSQIQVLSRNSRKWLSPIALPGTGTNSQLQAISLSPDGSKLAVSDIGGRTIYMLNPDNPAAVQSYSMSLDPSDAVGGQPCGLAIGNNGVIYFVTIGGLHPLHKLDTTTRTMTALFSSVFSSNLDKNARVLLSPDGSRMYTSFEGITLWMSTADSQPHYQMEYPLLSGAFPDLSLSADGSTLALQSYFTDNSFAAESSVAYLDWEVWFAELVSGQKLNHDGSILFQPTTDAIDMYSRNTGRVLYRILIPGAPASVYDPLVVAGTTNTVAVITATGVLFVDLSGLPISAALAQPFSKATHSIRSNPANARNAAPPTHRTTSVPLPSFQTRTVGSRYSTGVDK